MKKLAIKLFSISVACFACSLFAQQNTQIAFSREVVGEQVNYEYQWIDSIGVAKTITFSLIQRRLAELPLQQIHYKHHIAMRYVAAELTKYAQTIDPRVARILVRQRGDQLEVSFRGQNEAAIQRLKAEFSKKQQTAYQEYLYEHYLTKFTSSYGQQAIKPDHKRYVAAYTKALIPASQAFYEQLTEGTDARDYINLLLSWVQSIPYNDLTQRSQSNGSGFLPPIALIDANRGDCDSKSVLVAAMIRAFLPSVPIHIVLLPDHALLAVAVSQQADDEVIMHNGYRLVLMEPTGPASMPFGQISETSRAAIARDLYILEAVP